MILNEGPVATNVGWPDGVPNSGGAKTRVGLALQLKLPDIFSWSHPLLASPWTSDCDPCVNDEFAPLSETGPLTRVMCPIVTLVPRTLAATRQTSVQEILESPTCFTAQPSSSGLLAA